MSVKAHGQRAFIQSRIVNFLRAAEGGWRTADEIIDHVYGSNGAPSNACLAVLAFRLRARGFPIIGRASRGYRYAPEHWKPQ